MTSSKDRVSRFVGRVFPEEITLEPTSSEWSSDDLGVTLRLRAVTSRGELTAEAEVSAPEEAAPSVVTIAGAIELVVGHSLDLLCLATGVANWVKVTHILLPDGRQESVIRALPREEIGSQRFDLAHDIVSPHLRENPHLRHALHDLNAGSWDARDTFHYAHRAIEAVRAHFHDQFNLDIESQNGKREAWRRLRDALGVDEGWLRELTTASLGPRHGRFPTHIPATIRIRSLLKAREVVGRFCVYLAHGGNRTLSEIGFRPPTPT